MKRTLVSLGIGFGLLYLLTCFTVWQFASPAEWGAESRLMYAVFGTFFSVMAYIYPGWDR